MRLSRNFQLSEFTKSMTAIRHGIDNDPPIEVIDRLQMLVVKVLQPVREEFDTVRITSGYRSPKLNALVGGSKNSQHILGEAADFECVLASNWEVANWIADNLDFDQLILEHFNGVPTSGWVHCSYQQNNRRQALIYDGAFKPLR